MSRFRVILAALLAVIVLSSCAGVSMWGEELNRAFNGVEATMTTYDQDGKIVDQVHGTSFRVTRDTRFDTSNSDGTTNDDSQVLLISLGNDHISHVGSTLILAESGLEPLIGGTSQITFSNYEPGTPILNDIIEMHRNLWQGKAKTLLIRSQDGDPIAVYAGNAVEIFATDVPKSTAFRVDGRLLFVYRADYTIYDTALLQ